MGTQYLLAPDAAPPWRWRPDDLATRMRRRWPRLRTGTDDGPDAPALLHATIRDHPPIRALAVTLPGPGWAVVIDTADPAAAVDFTLWYLGQVPGFEPPVRLAIADRTTVPLASDTTADELLTVLVPPDVPRPDAGSVGALAAATSDRVTASVAWQRVCTTVQTWAPPWTMLTGLALVATLDLATDTGPLLREAVRILALRAAVYELTGSDTTAATLVAPPPVDDTVRAVLAEHSLCRHLIDETGVRLVAQTTAWTLAGWQAGDYTYRCYRAAWGEPDPRYWLDADETRRRLAILARRYADIGIGCHLRRHSIRFERWPDPSMVAV